MAWFLADDRAGGGFALTGWHTPPVTRSAPRSSSPSPRRRPRRRAAPYGRGLGPRAGLDAPRGRDRRGGRRVDRLGTTPRVRGGRTQLAHGARPDGDRAAGRHAATGDRDRYLVGAPRAGGGPLGGGPRGRPGHPRRGGHGRRSLRGVARARHARERRPARGRVRRPGGREVVGYAKLAFSTESTERAFHDLTGVKRAHRGRGIASALKATQIRWAKEQGFGSLQTANEVRNAPIRHLNAKHGYVLEPGAVIVRRALA